MSGHHEDERDLLPASSLTRRRFLGVVGTTTAAATLAACRAAPPEELVPYVERPPEVIPGRPSFYATAATRSGYAVGLIGESREGRPIKIEGNPRHPASLGGSGAWEQAATLSLYDGERARQTLRFGRPSSWGNLTGQFAPGGQRSFIEGEGEGLHLWLEPTSSEMVRRLLEDLRVRYPRAKVWFDPSSAPLARWEASRRVFGRVLETRYAFEHAARILSLDSDFLSGQPMSLAWARKWAERRHVEGPEDDMSRMYAVEPAVSVTGLSADHRLSVRAIDVQRVAMGVLGELARHLGLPAPLLTKAAEWRRQSPHPEWVRACAKDLADHRGSVAVVVGDRQPRAVHELGFALNQLLDAVGRTVHYGRSPIVDAGEDAFHPDPLLEALDAGAVDTLVTLEANPAFTAPSAWRLPELLAKADTHVRVSAYRDETAADAEWFVPSRHFLESWGDARALDGMLTPVQPLIRPLFGGRQIEQVLAMLAGRPHPDPRKMLVDTWEERRVPLDEALGIGLVPESAFPTEHPHVDFAKVAEDVEPPPEVDAWELIVQPDPRILDGRFANNAWLQELPEPVTKLVWGNAALMSPASAREMSVSRGDVVDVKLGAHKALLPVWPQPGMAERTVLVWLGHGRRAGGRIGRGVGVDVGPLRPADGWFVGGVSVRATAGHHDLVSTQDHHEMEGRPIVLRRTLEEFRKDPGFAEPHDETPESIYPDRVPENVPQWGMAIDLDKCTGCSACVVACQAENNIPAVGKAQVAMGREMHWMRIDRYYTGEPGHERVDVQPMLCQHCEQAPCEYVCPVNATVHSPDGLNEMIYNRCVGTRFCSNNCPYKVRRFNWFDFNRGLTEPEEMGKNPDVTVRARGVMEKCTYCVQRIRRAEIEARLEGQRLRDVEVETACQQACPTGAIVFGQVSDPHSQVSRNFENPRTYAVLNDLGTRPRTRYLARITNPNPAIEG